MSKKESAKDILDTLASLLGKASKKKRKAPDEKEPKKAKKRRINHVKHPSLLIPQQPSINLQALKIKQQHERMLNAKQQKHELELNKHSIYGRNQAVRDAEKQAYQHHKLKVQEKRRTITAQKLHERLTAKEVRHNEIRQEKKLKFEQQQVKLKEKEEKAKSKEIEKRKKKQQSETDKLLKQRAKNGQDVAGDEKMNENIKQSEKIRKEVEDTWNKLHKLREASIEMKESDEEKRLRDLMKKGEKVLDKMRNKDVKMKMEVNINEVRQEQQALENTLARIRRGYFTGEEVKDEDNPLSEDQILADIMNRNWNPSSHDDMAGSGLQGIKKQNVGEHFILSEHPKYQKNQKWTGNVDYFASIH